MPERIACKSPPRGLASVELVFATPILLLLAALIINYGTAASWRIRGLAAARYAGFGARQGRDALFHPPPASWIAPASLGLGGSPDARLDPQAVAAVGEQHPVIHGPLPLGNLVNADLLDPRRDLRHGWSHRQELFPVLQRLGRYLLESRLFLLDGEWQHHEMGISNLDWRIPLLYSLATDVPMSYPWAYLRTAIAILEPVLQRALLPLERDEEYLAYAARFFWPERQPHFYRYFPAELCTLDHSVVQQHVDELIDRIQGRSGGAQSVARWMAEWFRDQLYARAIRELQNQVNSATPGQAAAIRAEIADLEAKRQLLDDFANSIP